MDRMDVHPSLNAIVNCNRDGQTYGAIINTLGIPMDIPKGTRFGTVTSTCPDNELGQYPGRMATLGSTPDLTGPQRRKVDREEYIKAFVSRSREEASAKKTSPTGNTSQFDPRTCSDARKREWLQDNFDLKSSPFIITTSDLRSAEDCLLQFWDSFSHDGSYGVTNLLKHDIVTTSPYPIKCKYRPINRALEPDLRLQLDKWLENDVIEPAMSPWSANLVAAKKKNGAIRWCLDWRALNDATVKDSYPMPNVGDTLARLAGSTCFSNFDMSGAFHCIPMEESAKEKTAFASPYGSFQQKRLGFGLCNGPATYCRLVERILQGIPTTVAVGFLDDGVIHSRGLDAHIQNLTTTLSAYAKAV
jgi:hypothetical protein